MDKIPHMVDMKLTKEEKQEATAMPSPSSGPDYPYGLCISLCEDQLEKLDLDDEDVQPGDMIHMNVMATVTSVSKSASQDHSHSRIELQITHIGAAENEDTENEEEESEDDSKNVTSRLYR